MAPAITVARLWRNFSPPAGSLLPLRYSAGSPRRNLPKTPPAAALPPAHDLLSQVLHPTALTLDFPPGDIWETTEEPIGAVKLGNPGRLLGLEVLTGV